MKRVTLKYKEEDIIKGNLNLQSNSKIFERLWSFKTNL